MIMSALYMYMAIVAFVYLSFLYLDWRVNPQWTTSQTKSSELFSTYFLYIHTHTQTSRTIQFCFFLCRKKKYSLHAKKLTTKLKLEFLLPSPSAQPISSWKRNWLINPHNPRALIASLISRGFTVSNY